MDPELDEMKYAWQDALERGDQVQAEAIERAIMGEVG
jgi:hypothetical protein